MSPPVGERKRAKKPKARTGCVTCKSRRVKCDEGVPSCMRCVKFGIRCEGYRVVPPPTTTEKHPLGQHQFKILLPRGGHDQTPMNPLANLAAFSTPFHDAEQNRYFLYFQESTVSQLSGPFNEGLFSSVALQACCTEPALMRLVAALGALDKSSRSPSKSPESKMHLEHALLKYGQALHGIQKIIDHPSHHSPRLILLAALLIFCFENLQGDIQTARKHLRSALHLLRKQLSLTPSKYTHTANKSPTSDLEESIIASFVRLDNGLFSRPDLFLENPSPNPTISGILDLNYAPDPTTVPQIFTSVHDARNHLETLQYHTLPLLTLEFHSRVRQTPFPRTPATEHTYACAFRDFQNWNKAFTPLYIKSTLSPRNPNYHGAAIMRARGMTTVLAIQGFFPELGDFDTGNDLERNCREVLRVARGIASEEGFRRGFVLDCGIIPGVFMAMVSPVAKEIGREALELMRSLVPRREGIWDSAGLVKVGEAFFGGS